MEIMRNGIDWGGRRRRMEGWDEGGGREEMREGGTYNGQIGQGEGSSEGRRGQTGKGGRETVGEGEADRDCGKLPHSGRVSREG